MRAFLPAMALATLLAASGCLQAPSTAPADAVPATVYAALDRAVFNATGSYSMPLEPGAFGHAAPQAVTFTSFDGTPISLGVHRPDIPGCPTDLAAAMPERCRTPVIIDAGPYFTADSVLQLSTRPPSGIWFVPHGYTMVYMALRGTGGSGGCMEFMSLNEQKDVDAVVTWAGQAGWSTGSVGMIGRSYDGTTPWWPAAMGNPHLKTIVPISGITDQGELMFANGTSELRGPIMSDYVYWFNYGLFPEEEPVPSASAKDQACAEVVKGAAVGPYTAATGDNGVGGADDYWAVRAWREAVLENYRGSVFIIHGMQDWNVNPRMVVPYINELQDHGIRVKAWLGQWPHAYPDRADEHPNVRWDWAETLLRWLDHELKGAAVDTGPVVEVEDHRHDWWAGTSYPPRDAAPRALALGGDGNGGTLTATAGAAGDCTPTTGVTSLAPVVTCSYVSEPLASAERISGLVGLALKVTPTTANGGTVYAQLYDAYPDWDPSMQPYEHSAWLGHAWINLLYHEGGHERQTLVPGMPVVARMQFEPLEAYLPAGHRLHLVIQQDVPAADGVTDADSNIDLLPRPEQGPFTIHADGASVLTVPLNPHRDASPYEGYRLQR